jgi:putative flippase GtrA
MNRKGLKYILAGAISWAFDYGTLILLYYVLNLRLGLATTAAFIIGLIVNFGIMKYWVFADSSRDKQATLIQSGSYGLLTAFNLLVTNLIVIGLSKKSIGPEISKIIATGLIACWNFFIYKGVIFKEKPSHND